jgi:hypothetical protein
VKRWYRIDLNPQPWAVGPLATKRAKSGKMIPFMGKNEGLATYQDGVRSSLEEQGAEMVEGMFRMEVWFWRRIDEYETRQAKTARNHEADCTNLLKGFEDAGHKILYKNDVEDRIIRPTLVEQNTTTDGKIIMSIEPITQADIDETLLHIPDSLFIDPHQGELDLDDDRNAWPPRS